MVMVLNVPDALDRFRRVFRHPLGLTARHASPRGHDPVADADLDVPGIKVTVLREPVADLIRDLLIGALVTRWADSRVQSRCGPVLSGRLVCLAGLPLCMFGSGIVPVYGFALETVPA